MRPLSRFAFLLVTTLACAKRQEPRGATAGASPPDLAFAAHFARSASGQIDLSRPFVLVASYTLSSAVVHDSVATATLTVYRLGLVSNGALSRAPSLMEHHVEAHLRDGHWTVAWPADGPRYVQMYAAPVQSLLRAELPWATRLVRSGRMANPWRRGA